MKRFASNVLQQHSVTAHVIEAARPWRSHALAYRTDLDGLRALAILSVIAFHLHFTSMPGGFVGVDIFFVLSGYLIGSILLADLRSGTFSLREFYVRRIRRIFPALLVTLLATIALSLLFIVPGELSKFAASATAAVLSTSNLYFATHSSYFDATEYARPAMQTWSLGVEEQFYIIFPPLLWLLSRRTPRQLPVILFLLALVSLALSILGMLHSSTAAFFSPDTRAYELLTGVLIALPGVRGLSSLALRNLLALLGLAGILYAIFAFSSSTPFPGYAALLPCLGSALLIYSGLESPSGPSTPRTVVSRIFATRPLVFIGLISYSLYLWHWPLIVFQGMGVLWGVDNLRSINRWLVSTLQTLNVPACSDQLMQSLHPLLVRAQHKVAQDRFWWKLIFPGLADLDQLLFSLVHVDGSWVSDLTLLINRTLLISTTFVVAMLSWLLVEQPFRNGRLRLAGGRAFWFAGISAALVVGFGIFTISTNGLPRRFPAASYHVAAFMDEPRDYRNGSCMVIHFSEFRPNTCLRLDPNRPNWLLLGDSHAAANWVGLAKALPRVNILQANSPACRPDPLAASGDCGALMQEIFTKFLPAHHVDRILVSARWVESDKLSDIPNLFAYTTAHAIPVTMLGPVQEYDAPLPRLLSLGIMRHDPTFASRHRTVDSVLLDNVFAQLANTTWHIPYVSLVKLTCPASGCIEYADPHTSAPMLIDTDHLSTEGSILLGQKIAQQHLLDPARTVTAPTGPTPAP